MGNLKEDYPQEWREELVRLIRAGGKDKERGMEMLWPMYKDIFGAAISTSGRISRAMGTELDDFRQQCFIEAVYGVEKNLRDPAFLSGYIWALINQQFRKALHDRLIYPCGIAEVEFDSHGHRRSFASNGDDRRTKGSGLIGGSLLINHRVPQLVERNTPYDHAHNNDRTRFTHQVLSKLNARDREILTRFYLNEQTEEAISEAMHLTPTQYRLTKSRAKAKAAAIARKMRHEEKLKHLAMAA